MNTQSFTQPKVQSWKKAVYAFFSSVVVLCVLMNAVVAGTSVDYGMQARTLQQEQLQLALQRKELEATLAEATSLNSLRKEAEAQGFLPARTIVYANSLPVALR